MFRRLPSRLGYALRGVIAAFRLDQAFAEHLVCAALVGGAAIILRVNVAETCLLALCIATVVAAEMFNTALEQLAKAVDAKQNPLLGSALDISAGGVLVASCGAAAVGGVIFVYRLGILWEWWPAGYSA